MMKKSKKPVSIVLSLLMVVGMFAIVPITANAADPATFTVTWKNWNGDTLETDTAVEKDTLPSYDGAVPAKADDEKNTYTFAAWDDGTTTYLLNEALPPVTGDVTYTAVFTAEEKHAGELETLDLTNYYEKINETNYAKEHAEISRSPAVPFRQQAAIMLPVSAADRKEAAAISRSLTPLLRSPQQRARALPTP